MRFLGFVLALGVMFGAAAQSASPAARAGNHAASTQPAGSAGTLTVPNRDAAIAALPTTDRQPIGFTGYIKDSESGLYYANARYYDPAIARFITEDPEAGKPLQPPSLHRYLYAYGNPTVFTDPTGRESSCFSSAQRIGCGLTPITPEIQQRQERAYQALVALPVIGAFAAEGASVASASWAAFRLGGLRWGLATATTAGAPLAETLIGTGAAVASGTIPPPTPIAPLVPASFPTAISGVFDAAEARAVSSAATMNRTPFTASGPESTAAYVIVESASGITPVARLPAIAQDIPPSTATKTFENRAPFSSGPWGQKPTVRGNAIESHLARTEYSEANGWYHVGAENNGYFPLVDFQRNNILASVKTIDTNGSTWLGRMRTHIDDLGTNGATIDGQPANMVLDIRVQPGGAKDAAQLIEYGQQLGVTVVIKEFK